MDAYRPPPPFMRPPPPDPYHQYYQHPERPPVPPPPQHPQGGPAWYSNNQYHYPHSPSPPPPPPPSLQSEHHSQSHSSPAYPPPPLPFPGHQQPFSAGANNSIPFLLPPRPPLPSNSHIPPPYPHPQEWNDPNWGYQGQIAQANNNADDWAVKAREWAAGKPSTEDQHLQSAFPMEPAQPQYPDRGYQDIHQQSVPGLSYQHSPVPPATQPDRYPYYPPGVSSSAEYSHQENLPTSSANHQQEVPSSYSSVAGGSSIATQSETAISAPGAGGPALVEQPYGYGDQTAAPPSSLRDQPLQLATVATSTYPSHHNVWPQPAATSIVYPPIPSSLQSAQQQDPSMVMPLVPGHTMPPFGRFHPPNHQSAVQSGGPSYAFCVKPPLHPAAVLMDDTYASSALSERPKKAPVPNWLKEEILKKKATLGKSSVGNPEGLEPTDDGFLDKPPVQPDQLGGRSFSSSKLNSEEEEEENEDDVEAARTAAINLEIKRILTEVLLKVTDELFDEIATKVISEDVTRTEVPDQMHQASAKILIPLKGKESATEDASRKSSFGSVGGISGLVSYASDGDDDDDDDDDGNDDAERKDGLQQQGMKKLPDDDEEVETKSREISPKNDNSRVDEHSEKSGSNVSDLEADVDDGRVPDRSSGKDDTLGGRGQHPDGNHSDKDAKHSGVKPGSDVLLDSHMKSPRRDMGEEVVSRDRSKADDKNTRKENADLRNGSRDATRQKDIKGREKDRESESYRKAGTHLDAEKKWRERERQKRKHSEEDNNRKGEREKDVERSRHRHVGEVRQNRRRRSSATSDDSSEDSRRNNSRRNRSPSPVRTRRRKVSRSPHRSRHSPYSSLDTSRVMRRSRSRSPRRRSRG